MIVAQARAPAFYQSYGVPDTVNGRFEMLVLHIVLVLNRFRAKSEQAGAWGQGIFDHFCSDMDGNLREMGVGDLAVPANMRRIGEAFYGRQAAYEAALAEANPTVLAEVLGRTIFGLDSGTNAGCCRLAAYAREAVRHLATQDLMKQDLTKQDLTKQDLTKQAGDRLGPAGLTYPDPSQIPSMPADG
jgi:cytochrome b pre-mRNA-processing protein 3